MAQGLTREDPNGRDLGFAALWTANVFQEISRQLATVAMAVIVVQVLSLGSVAVGIVYALTNSAYLMLGLPFGVLADRADRRLLLLWAEVCRLVGLCLVPAGATLGGMSLPLMIGSVCLVGVASVLSDVAQVALIPDLVGQDRVGRGIGRLQATDTLIQIVGPGLAALVLAGLPYWACYVLAAAASLGAAFALLFVPRQARLARAEVKDGMGDEGFFCAMWGGLVFSFKNEWLRVFIGCGMASGFASGLAAPQTAVYALRDLGIPSSFYSLALGAGSVGGFLMALVAGRVAESLGDSRCFKLSQFLLPPALASFPLLVMVGISSAVALAIGGACFGAVVVLGGVAGASIRARVTPSHAMGRISAATRVFVIGAIPVGSMASGPLGSWLAARDVVLLAGAVCLVAVYLVATMRGDQAARDVDADFGG